jgi:hypothetical protein
MNSLIHGLKRFFKNKNTVTILGVVVVLGILYFGYNNQINSAVNPILVPVAKNTISSGMQITLDDIEYISVAPIILKNLKVYRMADLQNLQTLYTKHNIIIPEGSLFYKEALVTKDELPNNAITEVGAGEIPFKLPVNIETTYGNSILPGTYIDIYMKAINNGQVIVGKLVRNVKVLGVKDSSGQSVFEANAEGRVPSTLIFGVKPEVQIMLLKASFLGSLSVELIPVPHGGAVPTTALETEVSSTELKAFIDANAVGVAESYDEVKPVINNVTVVDKELNIDASDNVGVTAYYVSASADTPSLSSANWKTDNVITVDSYGTYYVWVRDAIGNTASKTVDVTAPVTP